MKLLLHDVRLVLQGFFRRCITQGMNHRCSNEEKCEITPFSRNSCQYCRLKKCFSVGMSREGEPVIPSTNCSALFSSCFCNWFLWLIMSGVSGLFHMLSWELSVCIVWQRNYLSFRNHNVLEFLHSSGFLTPQCICMVHCIVALLFLNQCPISRVKDFEFCFGPFCFSGAS